MESNEVGGKIVIRFRWRRYCGGDTGVVTLHRSIQNCLLPETFRVENAYLVSQQNVGSIFP